MYMYVYVYVYVCICICTIVILEKKFPVGNVRQRVTASRNLTVFH